MPGPNDNFEALLRTQSLINSSAQSGGGGAVFGILKDVSFSNLKMPGLNSAATFNGQAPPRPGPIKNLVAAMGLTGKDIFEGLQKVAQAGAVHEASFADITGTSHGLGGFSAQGSGIDQRESGIN